VTGIERPTDAENLFLNLAYNKFYDIFDEVFEEDFWQKDKYYRFSRLKEAFAIYGELLNYEPIKWFIEGLKKTRPPMEAEISSELFKVMRNILAHFPFYDSWEEVWINNSLVNWQREGQSIDRFLKKYEGYSEVKYRFWEERKKKMTYLSVSFPNSYSSGNKIYLNDILKEKEGCLFSLIAMKKVLDSQVEEMTQEHT